MGVGDLANASCDSCASFFRDKSQMVLQMMDVFFEHIRERNLATFGVNTRSLKSRIGQRSQDGRGHVTILLEQVASRKCIQLIGAR